MDWFTIVAQIVNFLILVALLKHFLYGPIIRAMDQREETIRKRLEEADEKRRQAEAQAAAHREQQAELDRRRDDMLREAREQAERERRDRIHRARDEADELSRQWREAVAHEQEGFLQDVREELGRQAVVVARKLLADLADAPLEQQVIAVFVRRLEELDDEQRRALAAALAQAKVVQVRTAFETDTDARQRITAVVQQQFDEKLDLDFVRDDTLLCGMVLAARGSQVAWTLANYLDDARRAIEKALAPGEPQRPADAPGGGDGQAAGQAKAPPAEAASEPGADHTAGKEDHAEESDA